MQYDPWLLVLLFLPIFFVCFWLLLWSIDDVQTDCNSTVGIIQVVQYRIILICFINISMHVTSPVMLHHESEDTTYIFISRKLILHLSGRP